MVAPKKDALTCTYRATFVFDTRGQSEPIESITHRLNALVESLGGKVLESHLVGHRPFTRVVNPKHPAGIFHQITFSGFATLPEQLREKLRLDKVIDRILIESR